MNVQHAHSYGCTCRQCADMIKAITAIGPNGEYFFTDAELLAISESRDEPPPDGGPA
jgi:hypothetical protein